MTTAVVFIDLQNLSLQLVSSSPRETQDSAEYAALAPRLSLFLEGKLGSLGFGEGQLKELKGFLPPLSGARSSFDPFDPFVQISIAALPHEPNSDRSSAKALATIHWSTPQALNRQEVEGVLKRAFLSEACRRLLHDISQPIQAIYSFGSTLERYGQNGKFTLDEKSARCLRMITEQTERAVQFIKESRTEFTERIPHSSPHHLPDTFNALLELRFLELARAQVHISLKNHAGSLQCDQNPAHVAALLSLYLDILMAAKPEGPSHYAIELKNSVDKNDVVEIFLPLPIHGNSGEDHLHQGKNIEAVVRRMCSDLNGNFEHKDNAWRIVLPLFQAVALLQRAT